MRGHGFVIEDGESDDLITGFFTTRAVHAVTFAQAVEKALLLLNIEIRSSPELLPLSAAEVEITRCERISSRLARRIPSAGFTFY